MPGKKKKNTVATLVKAKDDAESSKQILTALKACELLNNKTSANEEHDSKAQYQIGKSLLAKDNGRDPNPYVAIFYLHAAYTQGHPEAKKLLPLAHHLLSQALEKDQNCHPALDYAYAYLVDTAENGSGNIKANAQFELGYYFYHLGTPKVSKDVYKAHRNVTLAMGNGHKKATEKLNVTATKLGEAFLFGEWGYTKNLGEAERTFLFAIGPECGSEANRDAQFFLGILYLEKNTPESLIQAIHHLTKAAQLQHAEANYRLGLCFEKGIGVKVGFETAQKYYEHAQALNLKTHDLEVALARVRKKLKVQQQLACGFDDMINADLNKGIQDLLHSPLSPTLPFANPTPNMRISRPTDYQDAQRKIAENLREINQNDDEEKQKAISNQRKQKEKAKRLQQCSMVVSVDFDIEDNAACLYLNEIFEAGQAAEREHDGQLAIEHYVRAISYGHHEARICLAEIYTHGKHGISKDLIKARQQYKKIEGLNKVHNLGLLDDSKILTQLAEIDKLLADENKKPKPNNFLDQKHVSTNSSESTAATVETNKNAQSPLETIYQRGNAHHLKGEVEQAIPLLSEAARGEHYMAMIKFGHLLYMEKRYGSSFKYFAKATDEKHKHEEKYAEALFQMGVYYAKGIGTDADNAKAVKYYRRAAEKKYPRAIHNLAIAYREGKLDIEQSDEKAHEYTAIAANLGYAPSQYNLFCDYYYAGDFDKACMWLKESANNGFKPAIEQLELQGISNSSTEEKRTANAAVVMPHSPTAPPPSAVALGNSMASALDLTPMGRISSLQAQPAGGSSTAINTTTIHNIKK